MRLHGLVSTVALGLLGCSSPGAPAAADAALAIVFPDAGPSGAGSGLGSPVGPGSGTGAGLDAAVPADGGATTGPDAHLDAGRDGGGSPGAPTTLTPGSSTLSLTVAGASRSAVLYVPTGATRAAPLVIALHGDGDTDTNFLATSGLSALADQRGFVLLAPQGMTRDITVGGQTVPRVDWDAYNSVADGNLDLPFLEQLRTQLQATHQVDAQHTFVFGYSQGGYMAFLYGMSDASVLSCAGVLAASSPYGGGSGDPLISGAARKIPVAMQVGTADSAFSAAQATETTLTGLGFPVQWNPISGAGHVPIPGDLSVPLGYCLGQAL